MTHMDIYLYIQDQAQRERILAFLDQELGEHWAIKDEEEDEE